MILYINNMHCEDIEELKNYFINKLDSQNVVKDILDYGRSGDLSKWLREKGEPDLAQKVEKIDHHQLCNSIYIEELGSIITNRKVTIGGIFNRCLEIEHVSYDIESKHKISIILSFAILDNINEVYNIQINTNWGNKRTSINLSKFSKNYKSKMKLSFENNNNLNNFEGIQELLINDIKINIVPHEEYLSRFINYHEYVDLGLPSGLKWATCNVGACKPEDYGDYYAWGEITTNSCYIESNCKTYRQNICNIEGNDEYDTAQKEWGGSWRLPTYNEYKELKDECTWNWVLQNDVYGYKVTSKKNGNSIFLPAAGYITEKTPKGKNNNGKYWCSTTPEKTNNTLAYSLLFDNNSNKIDYIECYRFRGQSVRPVSK